MKPLRVLITNVLLYARSGTETYVRDLALGLVKAGHVPVVYSPMLGCVAQELRDAGVAVSDELAELGGPPDVIHGQHHPETMTALLFHPRTPGLFVCHDGYTWHDQAPRHPRLRHYVAVDANCRERLVADGVEPERISLIGNAVDTDRFRPRGPLPPAPARAVLFSNYASEQTHLGPVRAACAAAGLSLDVMGAASGRQCARPESVLGEYDLVFAKARCALEAMAAGCAVVLCDEWGAGPLVRAEDWHRLRAWNFGRRVCTEPLTAEALVAQVRRYDPADAAAVCRLTGSEAAVPAKVEALVRLYREVIEGHRAARADAGEESRAVAEYLRRQRPYELLYRVAQNRECEHLRHAAEAARAGWEMANREVDAIRRVAEEVHAGWKKEHEATQRLAADVAQAQDTAQRLAAAAAQEQAENERLRQENERLCQEYERQSQEAASLRALLDRTLSRRVWRGGKRCVGWLRRRLRRAGDRDRGG